VIEDVHRGRVRPSRMTSEFDTDTAVVSKGADVFAATITDRWSTPVGPNGGYLLATATRALGEVSPMPHPFAVTGHFLRPAKPGDAEVRTELVKTGRRHAVAQARLVQGEKELMVVVATFADLTNMNGREFVLGEPPPPTPPEDAADPVAVLEAEAVPPILRRVDFRSAEVPGFAVGKPSGRPEFMSWMRFADGRAADPLSLVFFADAMPPPVFEIGEFMSSTVEMTVHVRAVPAEGWLAMRVRTRYVIGGYHEEDAELWDSSGKLVAQSRQLALLGS